MNEMIFWGATGQAKVLRECMSDSGIKLVALFDRDKTIVSPFTDVPLHIGREAMEQWLTTRENPATLGFLVAVGGDRGEDRIEVQEYLEALGLSALTAIHRTAFIAESVVVGLGSQILANASVCVDVTIGRACIVNTGAIVDHESRLADGVHVEPGAHLAGTVDVGRGATIGTGAVVLPRIRIGAHAVIGAGAVVLRDVPADTTVVGNPATPVGQRA